MEAEYNARKKIYIPWSFVLSSWKFRRWSGSMMLTAKPEILLFFCFARKASFIQLSFKQWKINLPMVAYLPFQMNFIGRHLNAKELCYLFKHPSLWEVANHVHSLLVFCFHWLDEIILRRNVSTNLLMHNLLFLQKFPKIFWLFLWFGGAECCKCKTIEFGRQFD